MSVLHSDTPIELSDQSTMNRSHGFYPGGQAFEPLLSHDQDDELNQEIFGDDSAVADDEEMQDIEDEYPFSWTAYSLFALLGIAMLWAW